MSIPLDILLVLVVGGVSLVVGLTHLFGGSQPAALTDAAIQARLAHDQPDARITGIERGADGRAALVRLHEGAAVVFVLGDRLVSRPLPDAPQWTPTDRGLRLTLPDPGCPRIEVALPEDARQRWLA